MTTVTVQIGNSDDKLSQNRWSDFVQDMHNLLRGHAAQVHFSGTSASSAPWQNAAWVVEIEAENIPLLKKRVGEIREEYLQDSVAWTEGETSYI